jgi:predicted nucleotidyltransferase
MPLSLDNLRGDKRAAILRLAEKHGGRNVRVFGSVARGDAGPDSDIDFLVDFDAGRTLFDLIGLRLDLEELLGTAVDVVTPGSLRYVRERVLSEARAL